VKPQDAPTYIFALRDVQSRSGLAAAFGVKAADARDFEKAVPDIADVDGALVLDRLNMLIMQADRSEAEEIASREPFATALRAYRQARDVPITSRKPQKTTPLYDESEAAWGLQVTGVTQGTFTGRGIRVAVLDITLDDRHPDFSTRPNTTWHSLNGKSAKQSIWLHGTGVSGILAGPVVPSAGPRYGVAPDCELFFGRVAHDKFGYHDTVLFAGLNWALTQGCRVANISLGDDVLAGEPSDPIFDLACSEAADQGMLIVAAGGNNSDRTKGVIAPVDKPANSPMALSVGAIDPRLNVARFSPRGQNAGGGEVNLVAPGVAVRSARSGLSGGYTNFEQTSFATPFVAGIAALWLEKEPDLTVPELWQRLTTTAKPLGNVADFGAGLVQAP